MSEKNNKLSQKISDEQFIEAFTECRGSYAKTAKYIKQKYCISYTRQAVYERAQKFIGLERDMIIQNAQESEERMERYTDDETMDKKFRASLLDKQAARRSKYHLQLIRIEAKQEQQKKKESPDGYFKIDGKEFNF